MVENPTPVGGVGYGLHRISIDGKDVVCDQGCHEGRRPYGRQRIPSVTGIIGVMDKPGLPWGAAKETALFAVHHQNEWRELETHDAVERLRKHHQGIWNGRAAIGSVVHHVVEVWAAGCEAEVPSQANGYIDGLAAFWDEWKPQWEALEYVVRHPGKPNDYIGTVDARAVLADGRRWQLDWKTTAEQDPKKGLYFESWRLQHAAYRYAEEVVLFGDDGKEIGTERNPKVDACGVVHMRGDGRYELYEVHAAGDEHTRFLHCRNVWEWINRESKQNNPAPLAAPIEGAA